LFEFLLFAFPLFLYLDCTFVCLFDLAHHAKSPLLLSSEDLLFFELDLFSLTNHLVHFPFTHLLFLDPLEFSLLNLVDDHERPLFLSLLALYLTLLLQLQRLESLDLHHQVKTLLLLDPLSLESLGFIELAIADRHDFRVKHHLVHMLHIVVVLVEHLLSLG